MIDHEIHERHERENANALFRVVRVFRGRGFSYVPI
jgi:hypothetical protein